MFSVQLDKFVRANGTDRAPFELNGFRNNKYIEKEAHVEQNTLLGLGGHEFFPSREKSERFPSYRHDGMAGPVAGMI